MQAVAATFALLLSIAWSDAGQIQVRVEGYLDAAEEQIRPWEALTIRIGEGPLRRLMLTNLIVLSPGPYAAWDLLAQVDPVKPSLIFAGDAAQLDAISSAAPNQLLRVTGFTRYGSPWVLVTEVERSAPIVGPTPTPSLCDRLFGS